MHAKSAVRDPKINGLAIQCDRDMHSPYMYNVYAMHTQNDAIDAMPCMHHAHTHKGAKCSDCAQIFACYARARAPA